MAAVTGVDQEESGRIRSEIPEIDLLSNEELQAKVLEVWAGFLRDSTYQRISDAPAFPGLAGYDLAKHTRQVIQNSVHLADTMRDFWNIECDRDALIAAGLTHDASKLVEFSGAIGERTDLGKALLHAQLAGARCVEVGLPLKVAHMVTLHPFTPPHIHVKPQYVEFVILTWADLAAADTVFFLEGKPTHLEFAKRFFQLD